MNGGRAAQSVPCPSATAGPTVQGTFNDLYTAFYAVLDDAKTDRELVKLYKGSHAAADPHPIVTDLGTFFFEHQRGLFAYACHQSGSRQRPHLADLDAFDAQQRPRVAVRTVFDRLYPELARPGQNAVDVLNYLATRRHRLGVYRGGSSGWDEEARAFAAAHFTSVGVPTEAAEVLVFAGGAKGAFLAFCAAVMCHRRHDTLRHLGGRMLAPAGYYQSLRLIPPMAGGAIDVIPSFTGTAVADWLAATAALPRRCVYVPLVNNADGAVLTKPRALQIAEAILEHNTRHPHRPVHVLADDVYVGSYLHNDRSGHPIGAITGTDLGQPSLGRMSDWTLSVVTSSKTFAAPTTRIAFAATTNPSLRAAAAHYRTVLSHGRVPQVNELTAAAAICLTPQAWIDTWNTTYQASLRRLNQRLDDINRRLGYRAVWADPIDGGWYLPLRLSRRLLPPAASSVDAAAALLHYGGNDPNTGIAMLPGELFGHRPAPTTAIAMNPPNDADAFLLRGTLAPDERELERFTDRLGHAITAWSAPDGTDLIRRALRRARTVADLDTILANTHY
ncbi:aminotransferase class I/II-fold pyridoxal phosphate-dependent enzyme [Spirillospora sp. NPDC047279]|uniref:aminotransferase class I/II-fold pyridoxal phosphate-dependent enzyme n=1 Tax=Spirillospora sp. NPDC047279 TaxID=3155478 RepID=UPI003403C832